MYTSSLLPTAANSSIPTAVSTDPPAVSTTEAPVTSSPATVAAAAAAVAAQAQVQAQVADGKSMPLPTPQTTAPQMPQMAAAAAFGQYPPGMVFAAPDPAVIEDQPTYVNPKQYARILKRRESRKKQTGTDVTSYTPRKRSYMHESRHKHAMQRRRGPGGRFLSKEEREEMAHQSIKETPAVGQ